MYKKILYSIIICFIISGVKGQNVNPATSRVNDPTTFKAIETAFVTAPDSIQTSVYWYWLSGNVSKTGVVKDLEAMKRVGINRAFIGDIGLNDVPSGKVKFLSDEWWDILHTALKTATRLNIKIGLFNGPGWSQSGGPWVKPGQSMRYLTSSQIMLKGPLLYHPKLTRLQANFQDVRVLAYPVPVDYNKDISELKPKVTSEQGIDSLSNLMDNNQATGIHFKKGQQLSLDINTQKAYTARSVTISTTHQPVYLEGEIQAKVNNAYITIKRFTIDRRSPRISFGFVPWGRSVIAIPATTAAGFRILFHNISDDSGITELHLSSTAMVDSYIEKTLAKAWQTEDLTWNAYLWKPQWDEPSKYIIDPEKVIDISKYMSADGTLNWKVPAGTWIIERIGMLPTNMHNVPATPEATGLETDKMSRQHINEHFDNYVGEVLKRIPAEDRKTFTVVVADSYETGSQNWTDLLIPEFKQKYSYDPIPFIPVLQGKVVGNAALSDRFLWDLRRLIADETAFNYVGGLTAISHKHGLTTWLEPYGYFGFPAEFLQYGGQADEVAGEFWLDGRLGVFENRAAASAAHIYGKVKVSAESFTSAGAPWRMYPGSLKARGDRFFTDGINNTLLHVFIHQPEDDPNPGISAWFGTEFNRGNTWFFDMDVFVKYLKRSNFMLQQGQYVADAAYFIGEDAPRINGITDPALPKGYSFDYINADVIKESLSVKNGKLTLPNGISYSILVMPQLTTIRPELLTKIKEMVRDGAVILGPKPERSPSLQDYPLADKKVKQMANELWGNVNGTTIKVNHFGKGLVINGMDMQEALDFIRVAPDFKTAKNDSVLFIHRQLSGGSVYFISNQKNETVDITPQFRVTGKKPELWDAVTGTVRDLPSFRQTASGTTIPMRLAPNESAFVVFRRDGTISDTIKPNYSTALATIEFRKPWAVNFDNNMRGPKKTVILEKLTDWSLYSNDSVKYYSGAAYYHNDFTIKMLEKGASYVIDLGMVKDIAKLTLNGTEVGGVWTAPYRLDITKAIRKGVNKLEIKVVNTWVNRLLGDAILPAEQRKTKALFGPDVRAGLESSGLLGPVKIDVLKY
jgi:hypothetical protein